MFRLLAISALTLLLTACASINVSRVNPTPNIHIAVSPQKLAIDIADNIQNNFSIPDNGGIKGANVKGWRESLTAGFNNAYEDYFDVVDNVEEADLVLHISKADISFQPTAVLTNQYGDAVNYAVEAVLTHKTELRDANGVSKSRLAGSSPSKSSVANILMVSSVVSSAVESMYEELTAKLFSDQATYASAE